VSEFPLKAFIRKGWLFFLYQPLRSSPLFNNVFSISLHTCTLLLENRWPSTQWPNGDYFV